MKSARHRRASLFCEEEKESHNEIGEATTFRILRRMRVEVVDIPCIAHYIDSYKLGSKEPAQDDGTIAVLPRQT